MESTTLTIGKLLNQVEVAKRYQVTYRTLERWRILGIGPPHLRIGLKIMYREEDINRYEQDNLKQISQLKDINHDNHS